MSEYEQKLWDDRKELEAKIDKRDKLIAEMAESYTAAQAEIEELEAHNKYMTDKYVRAACDIADKEDSIEKLEQANKIMLEALKEIYKTNINGANIYSGAEGMQFDAKEAINQVKEMLGEK